MKANYPVEYMTAVLTADSGDVEKVAEIVAECRRMGIPVLPPDVNESFGQFTIVASKSTAPKIRFGLFTIKNFGEGIGNIIIDEREKNGKYTSLANFLERIKDRNLNKKSLEALIQCGALDHFEERGIMLGNMDTLLAYNKETATGGTQVSLFGSLPASMMPTLHLVPTEPMPIREKLRLEKELLGLYISGHPLDTYRKTFEGKKTNLKMLREKSMEGMTVVASGLVGNAKQIFTKRGDKMLFLTVEDLTDNLEVVIFPKVLSEFGELLQAENCVSIKGKISKRNGTLSMIAEAVKAL
ncbi:MAG: DNA polymerase III alpha subunit [Parcubacteria group bacterium Greene0416_14]|nr:MAG: DNA polymerase III alpha subunit [Parcubacteria group bacterium Greene0416_14]